MTPPVEPGTDRPKERRVWRARLAVLLLGLSPFVLLEAGLWAFGYGGKSHAGFAPQVSVFTTEGDKVVVKPVHRPQFRTRPFKKNKDPKTFRIFAVGDSVTWGWEPQSPKLRVDPSYPKILQNLLRKARPDLTIEVLNVGGVCHATHRLVHVVREVLRYQPDLVLLATGHSEFIEARYFAQWQKLDQVNLGWLRRWKTLLLARNLVRHIQASAHTARTPGGVVTGLELPLMAADRVRDASELPEMLAQSRRNLEAMVRMCAEANVPLVRGVLPSNLRHPPDARDEALQHTNQGLNWLFPEYVLPARGLIAAGKGKEAIALLRRGAARVARSERKFRQDWRLSVVEFEMGRAHLSLGDREAARAAFVRAKDLEGIPSRVLSGFNTAVRQVARSANVPLADLEAAFDRVAKDGIPGFSLFFDDCHPLPRGHEVMARQWSRVILRRGLLPNKEGK